MVMRIIFIIAVAVVPLVIIAATAVAAAAAALPVEGVIIFDFRSPLLLSPFLSVAVLFIGISVVVLVFIAASILTVIPCRCCFPLKKFRYFQMDVLDVVIERSDQTDILKHVPTIQRV